MRGENTRVGVHTAISLVQSVGTSAHARGVEPIIILNETLETFLSNAKVEKGSKCNPFIQPKRSSHSLASSLASKRTNARTMRERSRRASPARWVVAAFVTCVLLCARIECIHAKKQRSAKDADDASAVAGLRREIQTIRDALRDAKDSVKRLSTQVDSAERTLKRMDGLMRKIPSDALSEAAFACDANANAVSERSMATVRSDDEERPLRLDITEEIRRATEEHVRATLAGVGRREPTFADAFVRESVATVDGSVVTAAHVLPFRYGKQRKARYYAVGDDAGGVAVFHVANGELVARAPKRADAPVVSMTAYMLSMNTSIVVTGHADGTVAFTRLEQSSTENVGPDAGEWPRHYSVVVTESASVRASAAEAAFKRSVSREANDDDAIERLRGEDVAIEKLGVYRILGNRYVAAADANGRVVVFSPARSDLANVRGVFQTGGRVFAFRPYNKAVVALTQRGITYADIHAMTTKVFTCEGLMYVDLGVATFDARMNSRLSGVTRDGQVVSGFVALDGPRAGCVITRGRIADPERAESQAVAGIKGYLIVSRLGGVEVVNTTNAKSIHSALLASNREQVTLGGARPITDGEYAPVIATDGESLVIVAHPTENVVFAYESALYVSPPAGAFGDNLWFQPLAVMIALGVGIYSYRRQREVKFTPPEASHRQQTEDALIKLGYGMDLKKANALLRGEEPPVEEWTPATIRSEIQAARINGDL